MDLQTDDIDATHRIGRKNVTGEKNRTRPIIVRLLRRFTKSTIMKNKLKCCGISIFDDLTAENSQLLFHAKQHPGIESAWVFNGKVFAQALNGKRLKLDMLSNIDNEVNIHNKGN